jgi:hypothetical protein
MASTAAAQSACRQATATVLEHRQAFTVLSLTLPSKPTSVAAMAVIPNAGRLAGAYVFSLSQLVGTGPDVVVQMMPAAIDLAKEGHPAIVLRRKLTWPEIEKSVGNMQTQVLCAEQWLSRHSVTKSDNWDIHRSFRGRADFGAVALRGRQSQHDFLLDLLDCKFC